MIELHRGHYEVSCGESLDKILASGVLLRRHQIGYLQVLGIPPSFDTSIAYLKLFCPEIASIKKRPAYRPQRLNLPPPDNWIGHIITDNP
jgi:hypothetical protein